MAFDLLFKNDRQPVAVLNAYKFLKEGQEDYFISK